MRISEAESRIMDALWRRGPLAVEDVIAEVAGSQRWTDATVMARLPAERRLYAETLLRSRQEAVVSPLGCGWSRGGAHPLVTRLTTLMRGRAELTAAGAEALIEAPAELLAANS